MIFTIHLPYQTRVLEVTDMSLINKFVEFIIYISSVCVMNACVILTLGPQMSLVKRRPSISILTDVLYVCVSFIRVSRENTLPSQLPNRIKLEL